MGDETPNVDISSTTQLDEIRTSIFNSQFNHITIQPNWPDSLRWDTALNSGTVQDSKIEATGSGQNPKTQTRDRSNYAPGSESVAGFGVKIANDPDTDQDVRWGLDDGTDSIGYGKDSTDPYIYYESSGGGETKVHKSNWNGENLDSWFNDFNNLRICRIDHLWYKGGVVEWKVLDYSDRLNPKLRTLHVETPENGAVFSNPNLPAKFEVDGGTSSNTVTLEVNAVHYEKGEDEAEGRENGEFIDQGSIDASQWYHLISWEKKSNWDTVEVEPLSIPRFVSGGDVKFQLLINPSLTVNTARDEPGSTSASETAVKVTTDATLDNASEPFERRWIGVSKGGGGNKEGSLTSSKLSFNLPANQNITLAAKGFSGASGVTVRGAVVWEEFF